MHPPVFSRRITLPQNARYFQKTGSGSQLARTGQGLSEGSVVSIGDPEAVVFDHRDQVAVPLEIYGQIFYMLVTEIGLPELTN